VAAMSARRFARCQSIRRSFPSTAGRKHPLRECPRLRALVLPPRPKKSSSLIPQNVLFTRPSILIYDEHTIDLYQLICARYLTAVKGAENRGAARSNQRLVLDRLPERIKLAFQLRGPSDLQPSA
jgi:hypothetical protein